MTDARAKPHVTTLRPDAPPLIVIAAGGDGSRIGGDKPARWLGESRLIDRACAWAAQHSDAVALAVRPGQTDWGVGLPLLYDEQANIGPISALASAMREGARLGRTTIMLIGCDLPFLPPDLVPRLAAALPGHGAALPISNGRVHPLAALWRCDTDPLAQWIAAGGQSLWRYARSVGMAEVAWEAAPNPLAPDPFANLNDAAAIKSAAAWLTGQAR